MITAILLAATSLHAINITSGRPDRIDFIASEINRQHRELGRGPKLVFEMNDAQAARIREGVCRQAVGAYRKVRTDWAEAGFWNDPHLGDPAFYKEVVVPYLRKLDAPAERVVRLEATAAEYAEYFGKYALEWSDLRIMINRKRAEYLENRFFAD